MGATGIMGMQWAKHLGRDVRVPIIDLNESSVTLIQEKCHLNKLKVKLDGKEKGKSEGLWQKERKPLATLR